MNLTLEKINFMPALDLVAQIAKDKSPVSVYTNLLLDATEEGDIFVSATDGVLDLKSKVEGEVGEPGALCIHAKRLHSVINSLSDEHKIHIVKKDNNRAGITSGKGKYTIAGEPTDEFPDPPDFNNKSEDATVMVVDGNQFRTSISQTLFAASKESDRGLDSICFTFAEDRIEVVTTDSVMLSQVICKPENSEGLVSDKLILPRISATQIQRIFNASLKFKLWKTDSQVLIADDVNTLACRLFSTEYLNYEGVLKIAHEDEAVFDRLEVLNVLRRVATLATLKKGNSVRISVTPQGTELDPGTPEPASTIAFTTTVEEQGDADDVVEIESASSCITLSMDCDLLIQLLHSMKSKKVLMRYDGPHIPIRFESVDDDVYDKHLCLLPPQRDRAQ